MKKSATKTSSFTGLLLALSIVGGTLAITSCIFSTNIIFQPAKADSVIGSIPVSGPPYGIAYDAANGNIYVGNQAGNTVSVISGTTNAVIGTITVGNNPLGLA